MHTIKKVFGREILDSRGNPTVEVDLILESGSLARASVPSGASVGSYEAVELRDGGDRYLGKGVKKAVENINIEISQLLVDNSFTQSSLDKSLIALDGTKNKSRLGANAILGVSIAFAKAVAKETNRPLYKYFADIASTGKKMILPTPMMNIINGGRHADGVDFQEFMIVPNGIGSFSEKLRAGAEIFHELKKILKKEDLNTAVGDEGGYAPKLKTNKEALELITQAITEAGYEPGREVSIALDVAASEFHKKDKYVLNCEDRTLSTLQLIEYYEELTKEFPIISIEDGFAEDDWEGFELLTERMGDKIQIVGDDLFVTNQKRLLKGIECGATNAILVKPNQIGTITETIDTVKKALQSHFGVIISHRSGETEDTTIADLAVGLGVGQIKTGSLSRSERTAKYNQLLRIEEELN